MWKCYIKIMFKEHRTPLDNILVSLVMSVIPLDDRQFFFFSALPINSYVVFSLSFLNTTYNEVLYCSHLFNTLHYLIT